MITKYDARLGERLRDLRISRKIKQPNLATALGLRSQQQISDLENGKRHFTDELILNICRVFSISVLEFVNNARLSSDTGMTPETKMLDGIEDKETKLMLYKKLYLESKLENLDQRLRMLLGPPAASSLSPTKHRLHVII